MIILALRTDKPEAELALYDGEQVLTCISWQAHRQLAETLHSCIKTLLESHDFAWSNIEGIVAYQGPGSFTGLRIGLSVANTLAYGLEVPIVGTTGDEWAEKGVSQLLSGQNQKQVLPKYSGEPHITKPRK